MKKVSEAHFQKVLKRQKSANSTKKVLKRQFEKCSNDNFYKTLYFNRKSFCNILGTEWHLLPLEKTNLDINHDLYASGIRKNQDHPYLYGIGGLSV